VNKIITLTGKIIFILLLSACSSSANSKNSESQTAEEIETMPTEIVRTQKDDQQRKDEEPEPAEIIELGEDRTSIRILWRVSDYVLGDNFIGNESDANAFIFEPLNISDDQIIFMNKMCSGVVFTEERVDAADYISTNWQIIPQSIGIEKETDCDLVRTNCALFGFRAYLRFSDGRLIVPYKDVYFVFEPSSIY
jgi:hypothetical protein